MEQERHEVYERIPWETLERQGRDKNWLVMAVAGAVALGALAYSFMRSQPAPPPQTPTVADTQPVAAPTTAQIPVATIQTAPTLIAEADLYAVDQEMLRHTAGAHAEWLAVEYVTVDGSPSETLRTLLPADIPLPEATPGVQVFVDWARALSITETAPLTYQVDVLVRSLLSNESDGFVRQPPRLVTVEVVIGDDGMPRVTTPPMLGQAETAAPETLALVPVPEQIQTQAEAQGHVVGGTQLPDGRWRVVVLATDGDGVRRPRTIELG